MGIECMETAEYTQMDAVEDTMWWYRALHGRLLHALEDVQGRILDAGCGTGGFLKHLRFERPDLQLYAIDWYSVAAARASVKASVPTAAASVEALPFPDRSFDAVVSADVLCHRSLDPEVAVLEMQRVLRPGGKLILNLPAFDWLKSAHDRRVHTARRFTASDVRELLRTCGFTNISADYWNAILLPLMVVERKLVARGSTRSDVRPFHPFVDAIFFGATEIERSLPFRLPAGGSLMALASAP
jgi:ubiquinone/menaquinone biosynthesis C-methylase UbiE